MFKSLFLVFCLTFQFALHASGSDHEKHIGHSKMNSSKRAMLDKKDQKEVLQVLEANEALHASFFKYNAKEVEKQAKDLSVKIGKIQNKEIAKLLSFSALKLKEIKSTSNRDDNNKNYHLVSLTVTNFCSVCTINHNMTKRIRVLFYLKKMGISFYNGKHGTYFNRVSPTIL